MALFSDLDWLIIAAVATFLLFGQENGAALRTLGRLYGRALRLKQELVAEVSKAADLPVPSAGGLSLRGALLGLDAPNPGGRGIPAAVSAPPAVVPLPAPTPISPWAGFAAEPVWSTSAGHVTSGTGRFP